MLGNFTFSGNVIGTSGDIFFHEFQTNGHIKGKYTIRKEQEIKREANKELIRNETVEITNKIQPCNRIYYSTVH